MSYIGKTFDLDNRQRGHKHAAGNCRYFHSAVRKHGIDAFRFRIIEDNIPESELDKKERFWIQFYNTVAPNGYNLTHGGDGGTISEITRMRISESLKGKPKQGRPHTAESKEKIAKSKRGKSRDPETIRKMSEGAKGKPPWNKGKKTPMEVRKKQSESAKKRPSNWTNRKHREDSKRKMSESTRNLHRNPNQLKLF